MLKLFTRMIVAVFVVAVEWAVANYLLGWHKPIAWWIGLYIFVVPLTYVLDFLGAAANKACTRLLLVVRKIQSLVSVRKSG